MFTPESCNPVQDFVLEEVYRVTEAVLSWTHWIYREVQQKASKAGVPFPAPQIRGLVQEIKNDIMKIYADVLYNDLSLELDAVMQILQGPTATYIREFCFQALQEMARMQREYAVNIFEQFMELKQLFRPVIRETIEGIVCV